MAQDALPTEIWLRVASFIPDRDLSSLGAVNRFFYGIQTDRRYRHLLLDDDRPARLEGKLKQLR